MNKLSALFLALAASLAACAAPANDDVGASESHVTAGAAAVSITPGKYVVNGKMLMIYSACSTQNFLDEAAQGPIGDDGEIHAQEGDLCGGYKLASTELGVVTVSWDRDPTAHLDAETIAGCSSMNGTYLLMEPASYVDPQPGSYRKAGSTDVITVPSGCGTPTTLSEGASTLETATTDTDHPNGYLASEEGDVCSGYTYTATAAGAIQVTWAPPSDASVTHDPTVVPGCKSLEGLYALE